MNYLCLVYLDKENWNACSDSSCAAYAQSLLERGKLLAGQPLHHIDFATTVRVRNGQVSIVDGPFAETKEMLAGYYLIEAVDLNEAVRIAAEIPPAKFGSVEIRPVRQLNVTESVLNQT